MSEYMTEEEQIEQLKNWVKQYGLSILTGAVLALLIMTGWHYWQQYQTRLLVHASGVFDEMLTARAENNTTSLAIAKSQAEKLLNHYPKTPYAQLAALMLARDAVIHQDYAQAAKQLTWVIDHGKSANVRDIAKLRLARVLITEKTPAAALDILKNIDNPSFNGLADEVKGDAYLALNDTTHAKQAYQFALQELPKAEVADRPLLQMKVDNLE